MAEIDIQDLFHKCQGQAPEKRERITEQLPESDRAVLLKLLESDAELESDDDFLQPVTLPESTDIQTPELENTATLSESGTCLLYTSPSPRDRQKSRMPSSA